MILKITLLSDLSTGSGDTFNSLVDTEIVYDKRGIPYIPAKRLKGCIRESCLELEEVGDIPSGSVTRIFGQEGNTGSLFALSDVYPEKYKEMCAELEEEEDKTLVNSQNVLSVFSYTRTMTAMDLNTGVAKETSLRTMRVVKRGMIFEAKLEFAEELREEDRENLLASAECVAHMGNSRTRGLGLVKIWRMSSGFEDGFEDKVVVPKEEEISSHAREGRVRLDYQVTLNSPMLCKCAGGNREKTALFIEGGKMLGLIAGAMGNEAFCSMMDDEGEVIISNAYIACGGKRCAPARASLQKRKDTDFDKEGKLKVYDLLFPIDVKGQLTSAKCQFMNEDRIIGKVKSDIRYHHKRPSDKSVGKAGQKDDSEFYQMAGIEEGQTFCGFISAPEEKAKQICDALGKLKNIRMGQSRNVQYGDVSLRLTCKQETEMEPEIETIHDFTVKLNSLVIIYTEKGMVTSDVKVLVDYLKKELSSDDIEMVRSFLNYDTVGGYNVTWGKRKPIFTSLGKGSVLLLHSEKGVTLSKKEFFIGERISEGFGEIELDTEKKSEIEIYKTKDVLG